MQRLGFIHDMLDVKVLVLFVMARVNYPVTIQQLYELCYQDDCLSYFDICTAVPEMVKSGHLKEVENEQFVITEKGRARVAGFLAEWQEMVRIYRFVAGKDAPIGGEQT